MKNQEQLTLLSEFQDEQRKLHEKIDEWREWSDQLDQLGQPRFGEMNFRLKLICDCLESHFRHEEEAEVFNQIAETHPHHAQQSTELQSEHQDFIEHLNCLCEKLDKDEPEFVSWQEAKRRFEQLLNDLEAHEREEFRLLNLLKEQIS